MFQYIHSLCFIFSSFFSLLCKEGKFSFFYNFSSRVRFEERKKFLCHFYFTIIYRFCCVLWYGNSDGENPICLMREFRNNFFSLSFLFAFACFSHFMHVEMEFSSTSKHWNKNEKIKKREKWTCNYIERDFPTSPSMCCGEWMWMEIKNDIFRRIHSKLHHFN